MARIIELPTFSDERGSLTVLEKKLPFEIQRTYFIYGATGERGGHRHKKAVQAMVALNGTCEVYVNNSKTEEIFILDGPSLCLILEPEDWHTMDKFTAGTALCVFASEFYDEDDYIAEKY